MCDEWNKFDNANNEEEDKSVDIDANVNNNVRPNDGKDYIEVRVPDDNGKFQDKWMLRPKKNKKEKKKNYIVFSKLIYNQNIANYHVPTTKKG